LDCLVAWDNSFSSGSEVNTMRYTNSGLFIISIITLLLFA